MYRTVTLELQVKTILKVDEDIDISDVVNELDCSFNYATGAEIVDTEITDYSLIDSR